MFKKIKEEVLPYLIEKGKEYYDTNPVEITIYINSNKQLMFFFGSRKQSFRAEKHSYFHIDISNNRNCWIEKGNNTLTDNDLPLNWKRNIEIDLISGSSYVKPC